MAATWAFLLCSWECRIAADFGGDACCFSSLGTEVVSVDAPGGGYFDVWAGTAAVDKSEVLAILTGRWC